MNEGPDPDPAARRERWDERELPPPAQLLPAARAAIHRRRVRFRALMGATFPTPSTPDTRP